jgi:hypothetical protein
MLLEEVGWNTGGKEDWMIFFPAVVDVVRLPGS